MNTINFNKMNGLVPVCVQDATTRAVLMVGFMNSEALQLTIKTQQVTFYSRTKARLWTKGETTGHFLEVVSITTDCDQDALLILANPKGPACHLGTQSCFKINERPQSLGYCLSTGQKSCSEQIVPVSVPVPVPGFLVKEEPGRE